MLNSQPSPTPPTARIVAFGEVLWDLFPDSARFGGAPANFACHASILGAQVHLVSAVGDDDRGRTAKQALQRWNVDTSLIQTVPEFSTGTVTVVLDAQGKPTFTIEPNVAWDYVVWNDAIEQHVRQAQAVYFGTLGQRSEIAHATIQRALKVAGQTGALRILDVNLRHPIPSAAMLRESIQACDVLKLSDEELTTVCEACGIELSSEPSLTLCELRSRFNLRCVAMTRGAEGAVIVDAQQVVDQPGVPVEVCDTVGAGDAFTAALAIGLLNQQPLTVIAAEACRIASDICSYAGAVPDIVARTFPLSNL